MNKGRPTSKSMVASFLHARARLLLIASIRPLACLGPACVSTMAMSEGRGSECTAAAAAVYVTFLKVPFPRPSRARVAGWLDLGDVDLT